MAAVLKSIPSPTTESDAHEVVIEVPTKVELSTHAHCDDSALEHLENVFKVASGEEEQLVQATELMLSFEFQDVRLSLSVERVKWIGIHLYYMGNVFTFINLILIFFKYVFF